MKLDISDILDDWPYEPGSISARRIVGTDGKECIQMRLDMGLLQMATTGRPDGLRPNGCESWLAYYEKALHEHTASDGDDIDFELDAEACEQLRAESVLFYHRYLAEFVLEDYSAVQRDTSRNLRAMDICHAYATEDSDREVMEQYRPYVIMMCTRARALRAFEHSRPKEALAAVKRGIKEISAFHHVYGQEGRVSESNEIQLLGAMATEIESSLPVAPSERCRRKLAKAIEEERYEDAAELRDELRRITKKTENTENPLGKHKST